MKINIPSEIFRGYDIRGIADTQLTNENVEAIARGYATYLLERRIYYTVVGYDNRISSPRIKDVIINTLIDNGISVYDIGSTLTQVSYYACYYFRTKGQVMITASHNPKEYNGFKLGTGYSSTMETDEIIALRNLIQKGEFKKRTPKGKHIRVNIHKEYINDLFKYINDIGSFKIVVDSCNGNTGLLIPAILRKAGCTVIEQNTKPDGNFPLGTPDPTEKAVQERLARRVIKEKADIGFSYDTDGDRMGVVDEEGNLIWNDTLVALFAKDILEYMPKCSIVFNTLCSKQTSDTIKQAGGTPIIWKTGHSFIKAKVKKVKAPFGGELSGHFFFMDNFFGHDDGAMATLRLLSYLTRKKKSLKQSVSELPHYVSSPEIKLGLADDIKFSLIDNEIQKDLRRLYPKADYITIDGVRLDTKDEMIIIRASQNGPYITIKFEGKNQSSYNKIKKQVAAILKKYPQIDFSQGVNTDAFN